MIRIDVLPDDVLLEIFDLYTIMYSSVGLGSMVVEGWQSLVHVCRRWRNLVFGSPRRLNLQLFGALKTPVRDRLDVWPALPLLIMDNMTPSSDPDNIIAALGQSNRVRKVVLGLAGWQMRKLLAAMQVPFPELTLLDLELRGLLEWPYSSEMIVIPDSFLGGSAPSLQRVKLSGLPFPGLPKLLLSATHITHLRATYIPHSGYFSPESMVALLSVLSSLEELILGFETIQPLPDRLIGRPLPPKRSVIPALTYFCFRGFVEYLEDLVTRVDTPQLDRMVITFYNPIDFDTSRLAQFVNRTGRVRPRDAHMIFNDIFSASVKLPCHGNNNLAINISSRDMDLDLQLESVAHVCNSSLHPLSTVEDLYIECREQIRRDDAIENDLWLELLRPFTAVKNLYLSKEFAPCIAAALQELVGGRITEVLPSLQRISVKGPKSSEFLRKKFRQFVAARQLSGHRIAIWLVQNPRLLDRI